VQTGKAGPAVGAWTPNLVFGLLGIVLFVTTAKEVRWPFPSFHELFRRRQKKNGATTP